MKALLWTKKCAQRISDSPFSPRNTHFLLPTKGHQTHRVMVDGAQAPTTTLKKIQAMVVAVNSRRIKRP
jgi:hypothetical protein